MEQSINFCFVTLDINLSFVRPCVSMSDNQSGDQINPHLKHMNSDEFPELEFLLAAFWRIHVGVIETRYWRGAAASGGEETWMCV